ncbi:ATP-binding cassette domain-containing protein [Streptomyces sp. KL116D]|uniref:ATP-binding cassette domain-containing protein n=1 Tax=Streptomyces sp. KL116D TaxID=3045152 RepID=UPI00355802D8
MRDVHITDRASGREIVHGVSFDLAPGGTVGIVGESGSGKTLTCRAALGIPAPALRGHGRIHRDRRHRHHHPDRRPLDRAARHTTISAVFQDPASYLNPSIRVGAQIAEVLPREDGPHPARGPRPDPGTAARGPPARS